MPIEQLGDLDHEKLITAGLLLQGVSRRLSILFWGGGGIRIDWGGGAYFLFCSIFIRTQSTHT